MTTGRINQVAAEQPQSQLGGGVSTTIIAKREKGFVGLCWSKANEQRVKKKNMKKTSFHVFWYSLIPLPHRIRQRKKVMFKKWIF
jgi:hypothetical protein